MIGSKKCNVAGLAWLLLAVGGLNWGLIGLGYFFGSDWNVVGMVLGAWPQVEYAVYVIVGLAAIASMFGCRCKTCQTKM